MRASGHEGSPALSSPLLIGPGVLDELRGARSRDTAGTQRGHMRFVTSRVLPANQARRRPESNRCRRLCRPLRSHSATSPRVPRVPTGTGPRSPDGRGARSPEVHERLTTWPPGARAGAHTVPTPPRTREREMPRWSSWFRWTSCSIVAGAALLIATAPAAAHTAPGRDRDHHGHDGGVVRAALPPGAVGHIFVIELENEDASTTFGPGSPATYLNGTLLKRASSSRTTTPPATPASTTTSRRSRDRRRPRRRAPTASARARI